MKSRPQMFPVVLCAARLRRFVYHCHNCHRFEISIL